MLSDSIIAAATLVLATAFLAGYRNIWFLFAVLIIRSAGTGIQTPAVNAVLPQIVPQEHLMRVNGINSTLTSLTMFLSPAVSGAILSVAPLEATLFIDVITAVIGVSVTSTVSIPLHKENKGKGIFALGDIREGFAYLKERALIRRLMLFQIAVLFLISPSAFLTPLLVSRTFGQEVWRPVSYTHLRTGLCGADAVFHRCGLHPWQIGKPIPRAGEKGKGEMGGSFFHADQPAAPGIF